jgi:type II secretion system protein I
MKIPPSPRPSSRGRRGFSLLEVILALAILTGAIAVLGEAIRLGMRNAQTARDLTQAQLLCESKLAEIATGILPSDPVQQVPFDCVVGDGEIEWLYSISRETSEEDGLYLVCVTVTQNLAPEKRPVEFSLYRWVPDTTTTTATQTQSQDLGTGETGE